MEVVFELLWRKADDVIIVQRWIRREHAVSLNALLGMLQQQIPFIIEFIERAKAEALIVRVVDIIFSERAIIGGDEVDVGQVRAGLKALASLIHRDAIGPYCSGSPEASGFFDRQRATDIVDIAALAVIVDNAAQCELIRDRYVEHRLDAVAHLAAFGKRGGRFEARIEASKRRLVGDQANSTGLRARAEERSLRAGEDFDALNISGIDVEVTARLSQRLFVEIESNVGRQTCNAGNRKVRRRGGETANVDRVLTGARTASGHAWKLNEIVGEVLHTELFKLLLA